MPDELRDYQLAELRDDLDRAEQRLKTEIETIGARLRDEYMTIDRMHRVFSTKQEAAARVQTGRDRVLLACAAIGAIDVLATLIERIVH